ncbi:MAG: hypothetical protein WKG06_10985 [Segetibacter sp.]
MDNCQGGIEDKARKKVAIATVAKPVRSAGTIKLPIDQQLLQSVLKEVFEKKRRYMRWRRRRWGWQRRSETKNYFIYV